VEAHRCTLLAALQTSSSHLQGGLSKRSEESCTTGRCQQLLHMQASKDSCCNDALGDDDTTEGSEDDMREMLAFAVDVLSEPFGCGQGLVLRPSIDHHFSKSTFNTAPFLQNSQVGPVTSAGIQNGDSPGERSDARDSQALSTHTRWASLAPGSTCSSRKRRTPPALNELQGTASPRQQSATDPFASPAGSSHGTLYVSCRGQFDFSDAAAESAFSVASDAGAHDGADTCGADMRSPFRLNVSGAHADGLRFGLAGLRQHPAPVSQGQEVRNASPQEAQVQQPQSSRTELPWSIPPCNLPSPSTQGEQAGPTVQGERISSAGAASDGVQIVNLRDLKQHDLTLLDEGMFAQPCRGSAAPDFKHKPPSEVLDGLSDKTAAGGDESDLKTATAKEAFVLSPTVYTPSNFSRVSGVPPNSGMEGPTVHSDGVTCTATWQAASASSGAKENRDQGKIGKNQNFSVSGGVFDFRMGAGSDKRIAESFRHVGDVEVGGQRSAVGQSPTANDARSIGGASNSECDAYSPGARRNTTLRHIDALHRIIQSDAPNISIDPFNFSSCNVGAEMDHQGGIHSSGAGSTGSLEYPKPSQAVDHGQWRQVPGISEANAKAPVLGLGMATCELEMTFGGVIQASATGKGIQENGQKDEGSSFVPGVGCTQNSTASTAAHPTAVHNSPANIAVGVSGSHGNVTGIVHGNNQADGCNGVASSYGSVSSVPPPTENHRQFAGGSHTVANHLPAFGTTTELPVSAPSLSGSRAPANAMGAVATDMQKFGVLSYAQENKIEGKASGLSFSTLFAADGRMLQSGLPTRGDGACTTPRESANSGGAFGSGSSSADGGAHHVQEAVLAGKSQVFAGKANQGGRATGAERLPAENCVPSNSRSSSRSSSYAVTATPKRSRSAETDNRISKLRTGLPCLPGFKREGSSPRFPYTSARPPRTPRGEEDSACWPRAWSEDSSSTTRSTRGRLPRAHPGWKRRARSREGGLPVKRQPAEGGNPGLPVDAGGQQDLLPGQRVSDARPPVDRLAHTWDLGPNQARLGFGVSLQTNLPTPSKLPNQVGSPTKCLVPFQKPPMPPPGKGTPPTLPTPPTQPGKGAPPPTPAGKGAPPSPKTGKGTPPQKGAPPPPKGKGKGKPPGSTAPAAKEKAEPRKPDVIPGVKVKKLHWNSFRLDSPVSNTVWNEIDRTLEGANIDLAELDTLFADDPRGRRVPSAQRSAPVKKIQVLEAQRRRQICVMLARLPDMRDTHAAIWSMDKSRLDREQVELLRLNLPPHEEVKLMQNAQAEHANDEDSVWDTAEDFVIIMMSIPQYELRLQVWDFENSFQDSSQAISRAESSLSRACDCLLSSGSVRHLLAIALLAGNYLNGGTPRGRADGFAIETLMQMRTVKMSQADRPGSLIDYLVRQMEKKYPGELEEMAAAGDTMDSIKLAARYKLGDVREEMVALKRKCEQLLERVQRSGAPAADDSVGDLSAEDEVFRQHVEILSVHTAEMQELSSRFEKLEDKYGELRAWFHMADKTSKMPTDEFFGIWDKFFTDVNQSRKVLLEEERKQAKAQARQEARTASLQRVQRNSLGGNSQRNSARSSSVIQRRNTTACCVGNSAEDGGSRLHARSKSGTPAARASPNRSITKRRTLQDLQGLFKQETDV